jgi:hypothetical protein
MSACSDPIPTQAATHIKWDSKAGLVEDQECGFAGDGEGEGGGVVYSTDEDRLAEMGHPAKRVALRLALRSTDAGRSS